MVEMAGGGGRRGWCTLGHAGTRWQPQQQLSAKERDRSTYGMKDEVEHSCIVILDFGRIILQYNPTWF